ncbi:MAG: S1 RNA-binding domain-containing protein, partial [Candidatus Hydrogenedentota bacterium]
GLDLQGVVTNVTDFGAFVNVGVHQDGLVHLSELANRFVRDPLEILSVGDIVKVRVIGIDIELPRISLSIKALTPPKYKPAPKADRTESANKGESKHKSRPPGNRERTKVDKKRPPRKQNRANKKRSESRERKPKVESENMNTQLADQLAALKERLSSE